MGRAALRRVASRAASALAASLTGGTSKGVEVAIRWLLPVCLLVVGMMCVVLLIVVAGPIAGSDQASASTCTGGSPSGPGPTTASGVPTQFLPIFEGAGSYFQLGSNGWAYLAALNYAESSFGTDHSPGSGVLSGSNSAGAAGPMQIGIGGRATDNWDTYKRYIPANLPGGTEPPSVYNEVDAVYAAAAILRQHGAPGNWLAALTAWNDYQPEISEVTQLVSQYTAAGRGQGGATTVFTGAGASAAGCSPVVGPTVPGAAAKILPDGTAAIPAGAPPQVQQVIAAGNQIIGKPYPSPDQHYGSLSTMWPAYDCSGATSYVLYKAGLLGSSALVSGDFESWGQPGPGGWINVYGSSGHAFIEVAGIVLDTAHYAPTMPGGTGPRWQPMSIIPAQLRDGNVWTQRHPAGL